MFGKKDSLADAPLKSLDDIKRFVANHDPVLAGKRVRKEAMEGNLSCQIFLSQASLHFGDHENAELYTRLAAEAGDAEAQFNLALILIRRVDAEAEQLSEEELSLIQQSIIWHRRAADQGISAAKQSLDELTAAFPHLVSGNGTNTDRAIPIPDALVEISKSIAEQLVNVIRTEGDLWTFVVQEFDRLRSKDNVKDFVRFFPVRIHDVECAFGKSDPPLPSPGSLYIRNQVIPMLSERFDPDLAELTAAYSFSHYCLARLDAIHSVRLTFAVHFRNDCKSKEYARLSDQWNDVVHSLGGS